MPETFSLDARARFYSRTVAACLSDRNASVLVVGGGTLDRDVFRALGFENVVICNLDTRESATEFLPYEWSSQDAENLTFGDGSFDYVVAHAVLHHCRSPHRALLEMYRVARRGVLAFESREGWLMRLLERLKVTQSYEVTAVLHNESRFGGVGNSAVPNFIYRWNEREVEKTLSSFAPEYRHRISYFYGHALPVTPEYDRGGGGAARRALVALLTPVYELFALAFPRQQNLFGFCIMKPGDGERQPWLEAGPDGALRLSRSWGDERFRPL